MTEPLETLLAASIRWDGAANTDPIANLHHAIENVTLQPRVLILSEWEYALYVLQYETRWPTYRQRKTAMALFWHETKRWDRGRIGSPPSADEIIARVRALEPQ